MGTLKLHINMVMLYYSLAKLLLIRVLAKLILPYLKKPFLTLTLKLTSFDYLAKNKHDTE